MALEPLPLPLASVVLNAQATLNQPANASSTADAATGNSAMGAVVGLNADNVTVNSSGSIFGASLVNLSGTAASVTGNADADAGDLNNAVLIGINGNGAGTLLSVAGSGSLQGTATAATTAVASSVNGNSTASAAVNDASGLRAGDITISGYGTLAGAAQITQSATALSGSGSSNADAQLETLSGISVGTAAPSLQIEGVGALLGTAKLVSTATANTTGDSATDSATATQRIGSAIGFDALAGPTLTSIGGSGSITGQVEVSGAATANATTGNSSANSGSFDSSGAATALIGLRSNNSALLDVQGSGLVTADANGGFAAKATTVTGAAASTVAANAFGLGDPISGDSPVHIGGNGVVNASANLNLTASAATIDTAGGNSTADVTTNGGGFVAGMSLGNSSGGLVIDGVGSITAQATLTREATASSVTGGNSIATIGSGDGTFGIRGTGYGPSILQVAGNATQFLAQGNSQTKATASAVDGDSRVDINSFQSTGARDSLLQIGGDSSNTTFKADLAINTLSQSVSGDNSIISSGELVRAVGMDNTEVAIGGKGRLQATSQADVNANAMNVTGNAGAFVVGASWGILSSLGNQNIAINGNGDITSTATLKGVITATSTSGNAQSGATTETAVSGDPLVAIGIGLGSTNNPTVAIGGSGNIKASAAIGSEVNPFLIQSKTVSGNSISVIEGGTSSGPRAYGISGSDDASGSNNMLAQTNGGTIEGKATGNILLTSSSVNGDASAQNLGDVSSGSDIFQFAGVRDARLTAVGSGTNQVIGQSRAVLTADSATVAGTATSTLTGSSAGISKSASTPAARAVINVSGNSSGIAELISTTLSKSVSGLASSTTTNKDVFGINQYSIDAIGNSTILGQATSFSRSSAISVSGAATSQSTL